MKELEKTKRISIAAVISILVVVIALLAYKRPKHMYAINTQKALEQTISNNYVGLNDLNAETVVVDIRNQYEFDKGHIENAINIDASDILNDENIAFFETLKKDEKKVALYGNNPTEVIAPIMVLQQLGFGNLKILAINCSLNQDKLVTTNSEIEKKGDNINQFIQASVNKVNELLKKQPKPVIKKAPKPKIIIPIKKKKKKPVEGGC